MIDTYSNSQGLLLADAIIAATALQYDLVLVTDNTKDFQFIKDLKILKPPFRKLEKHYETILLENQNRLNNIRARFGDCWIYK